MGEEKIKVDGGTTDVGQSINILSTYMCVCVCVCMGIIVLVKDFLRDLVMALRVEGGNDGLEVVGSEVDGQIVGSEVADSEVDGSKDNVEGSEDKDAGSEANNRGGKERSFKTKNDSKE